MSSLAVTPNMENNVFANLGKPVVGNTGVANPNNGISMPIATVPGGMPTVGNNNGGLISGSVPVNSGVPASPIGATSTVGGVPTTTAAGTPADASGGAIGSQLSDIYGKGIGGLIGSEINNLGSDNSAYLQAYANQMAPINAENLSTLQTTLGNEGVGANSSTAAIAQGDFQSQVNSQESFAEQGLEQQDIQDLLGLTTGTIAPAAQAEQSSNWWSDILAPVIQAGGQVAGNAELAGALK